MAKKTKELEPIEEKKAKKETASKKSSSKTTKKTTAKKASAIAKAKKSATTKTKKSVKAKTKKAESTKTKKTAIAKIKEVATAKIKKTSTKKVKEDDTPSKTTTKKMAAASKKVSTSPKKATISQKVATTRKKVTTSKKVATTRKKATTSNSKKVAVKADFKAEYYDLPFMYNKTVVKILAQTPKMLFIYWEISDEDRTNLINSYGENFFNSTRPVLIIYNDSLNYSFEVDIDDFANSWYLHIDDANCEYHVELGRKPVNRNKQYSEPVYIPYYIYITSSNEMTLPNNKILFDFNKTIKFKNVKTGQTIEKDINQFKFITNYGIFTIQDLYKYLYPNENFEIENIELSGSSSRSGMFSSQFK